MFYTNLLHLGAKLTVEVVVRDLCHELPSQLPKPPLHIIAHRYMLSYTYIAYKFILP